MDKFAESELRFFISFCLGNKSNGQPAPESANMMDSAVTKPGDSEQTEISSDDSIEVIEITPSSPERVDSIPSSPCKVVVKPEPEEFAPKSLVQMSTHRGFTISSSDLSESVGAFFTRKLEAIQAFKLESSISDVSAKQSESEGITIFPNYEFAVSNPQAPSFSGDYRIPQDTVSESLDEFTIPPPIEHTSARSSTICRQNDQTCSDDAPVHMRTVTSSSEVEMDIGSDQASVGQARTTLAEALAPPKTGVVTYSFDGLDSSLPEAVAT